MAGWNPWHGCKKVSPGCQNCYVYRIDAEHGRDAAEVFKTADFALPLRRARTGGYKLPPGELIFTCFSSDFFLDQADPWREEAWKMIDCRRDLRFYIVTKRPERIQACLPQNWGDGWEHVTICCTVENQAMADRRLPVFRTLPLLHREIICEPLLEEIHLREHLRGNWIDKVTAGGESGPGARLCDYSWILALRADCASCGTAFHFKQTGAQFRKDGRVYRIARRFQQQQATRAGIDRPARMAADPAAAACENP